MPERRAPREFHARTPPGSREWSPDTPPPHSVWSRPQPAEHVLLKMHCGPVGMRCAQTLATEQQVQPTEQATCSVPVAQEPPSSSPSPNDGYNSSIVHSPRSCGALTTGPPLTGARTRNSSPRAPTSTPFLASLGDVPSHSSCTFTYKRPRPIDRHMALLFILSWIVDIGLCIEVLHCNLHLVTGKVVVHVADAFICIWIQLKKGHLIIIVVIVANQDIIEVHVQGHNPLITTSRSEFDIIKRTTRWEPYTTDILEMLPAVSKQASHLWLSRMHVPDRVLRQFGRVHHIPGPVDALDRVTRKRRGHIDWARYFAHFVQIWHHWADYIIPPDEETVGIDRGEYMAWYWSITRQYIARPGFSYDMRYEPRDHIERSLVDGIKHLHMKASVGLQDDISDSAQSTFISMQMYIDSVLSQVQRTDSSTSHTGPSEPCAGTPQEPDDAGPSHFSPDVMTVSQYGLYDVGASQILTDEGMTDTQPPQSTVCTYRRQRRHRGSSSTLAQQSQSDLLEERH
ncbi:hypothetical protein Taro_007924 [Colocasia esculenta]|uniref:Aminotransferase-like plant mobile domain-containing protein n=1 Tax=Colocasia esculenta TaxID=4460 RepID=A0A843U1T5_COLES|nr:hypothetical protein [Colocasia esculenta]